MRNEKDEINMSYFFKLLSIAEESKSHYERLFDTVELMLKSKVDKQAIKDEILGLQLNDLADTFLVLNPLLGYIKIDTEEELESYINDKKKVIMEVLKLWQQTKTKK